MVRAGCTGLVLPLPLLLLQLLLLQACAGSPTPRASGAAATCSLLDADSSAISGPQLLQHRQGAAFIAGPLAETYQDFAPGQSKRIEGDDFRRLPLTPPGEEQKLWVFGYPSWQDTVISDRIATTGSWEGGKVARIRDTFRQTPGDGLNFLDLGGNIGTFTLPIAAFLAKRGGRVFAVEAMPSIAEHLKAGIVENGLRNVDLYSYAIAGPVADNTVAMALGPTNKGGSAVMGNKPNTYHERTESAPLTTLDAMLHVEPGLRRVLVAKIDIEGNEGRALQGAVRLLREVPPCYLLIELKARFLAKAGSSVKEVADVLASAGYDTAKVHAGQDTYWLEQRDLQRCLARLAAGGKPATTA